MAAQKKPAQQKNPLLEQVIQAVSAKVAPDQKKAFDRIILAGMRLMYADETEAMLKKQIASAEPPIAAGQGAAKLVGLMLAKSKGTAPMKAMMPGGVVLTCEALDFMEKAGKVQLTPDIVSEAVQEFGSAVLQVIGVTPEKLEQMMARIPDAQKPQQPEPEPEQAAPPAQPAQPPAGQPLIGAM